MKAHAAIFDKKIKVGIATKMTFQPNLKGSQGGWLWVLREEENFRRKWASAKTWVWCLSMLGAFEGH